MKNYFANHMKFLKNKYIIKNFKEVLYDINLSDFLGYEINDEVKNIYNHYKEFTLSWFDKNGKYIGEINFVPFEKIVNEHNDLVAIMNDCYDVDNDEYDIAQDIIEWYPLFKFTNGDAFCLDRRNGSIVLYEHEVFDMGINLHGQVIAKSINDLFDKWEKIHFADVYYWDEICDDYGINLKSDLAQRYI